MQDRIERLLSFVLVLAGVSIAVAFVHREFVTDARTRRAAIASAQPTYLKDWRAMEEHGILVGEPHAVVRVIEFGDLECPACKVFHATYRSVSKKYGPNVALVFVHFPLTQHRFARPAARASECADSQGRFSAFHDLVYDKQDSLGLKTWNSYALESGIRDTARFSRCVADTARLARVEAGLALGAKIQLLGTPTVIVNGWRFSSVPAESTLSAAVGLLIAGKRPFSATDSGAKQ